SVQNQWMTAPREPPGQCQTQSLRGACDENYVIRFHESMIGSGHTAHLGRRGRVKPVRTGRPSARITTPYADASAASPTSAKIVGAHSCAPATPVVLRSVKPELPA